MLRPMLLVAVLLTCAASQIHAAPAFTLVRGAFGEPESLEPRQSGVSSEQTILRDLFEGLTSVAADGSIVPGAAQSWSVSDDGRTYTFKLRPDLRWSDGTPLRASDFVFGWRRSLAPATAAARASKLYVIRNAERVHRGAAPPEQLGVRDIDARTLIVELEHPLPWLPTLLAGEEGFPLPEALIQRVGAAWTRAGVQISNGAFRLADRKPRGNLTLARNPQFHGAASVRLQAVVYVPADDTRALVNRFRAGELDINGWPGFPATRQAELQRALGKAAVRVAPLGSVRYLRFNMSRPPFDDARVREALSLAVDRERLIRSVMTGGERVSTRPAPAALGGAGGGTTSLQQGTQTERLARARTLLAAARLRERLPRPVRLRVPAGNGEELCLAVAAMWTAAGVPTVLEQTEIKSMIADLRRGDFDIALTGAQDSPALEAYLERFRAQSSYNTGRYANAAFESDLDRALAIQDPVARLLQLRRAEDRLMRDHPIVPLIQEVARNLVGPRVRNWVDNDEDLHLSRYLTVAADP